MPQENVTAPSRSTPGAPRYLMAGLIAGLASAVINNIVYVGMIVVGGYDWDPVVAVSVLGASLLPNLLTAVAYFLLSRFTSKARLLLTIGVVAFVLISVLPHLGIGPAPSPALEALPEDFDLLTVPLHVVFGLTAIVLIPWWVGRE